MIGFINLQDLFLENQYFRMISNIFDFFELFWIILNRPDFHYLEIVELNELVPEDLTD